MTVRELAERVSCSICAGAQNMDKAVAGCYVCDLLSHAMSHVAKDNAWITVQNNINVIAVAVLTQAACVILPEGIVPDDCTCAKAEEEGVTVLSSKWTACEIIAKLIQ